MYSSVWAVLTVRAVRKKKWIWKTIWMYQKLGFLCFRGIHNSLPSFWAKLGYSRIKIDHKICHFIADSLLKDAVFMLGVNLHTSLSSFSVLFTQTFWSQMQPPISSKICYSILFSYNKNWKMWKKKCFLPTILDVNAFMCKYVQSKCKIFIWLEVRSLIPYTITVLGFWYFMILNEHKA